MRCSRFREAVSARLDGEDPGVEPARIDTHLGTCAECRRWSVGAGSLATAMSESPVVSAAPGAGVMATLLDGAHPPRRALLSLREWRIVLAGLAAVQLVVAWPGVMLHSGHASAHLAHELTSWDLGLALGFLMLAWLPSRAWGALPVVAALVVALVGASVADVVTGHALLGREVVHSLELAALGCLWVIARRVPRSSVVLRLA
jgi:predicted anti-sigma-YlaC factor YlaD